jgi:ribosomal protein S18 acetylase RimI-like enzyme
MGDPIMTRIIVFHTIECDKNPVNPALSRKSCQQILFNNFSGAEITENESPVTVEVLTEMDDRLREIIMAIDEAAFGPGSLSKWSLPLFSHYGRLYIARYQEEPAAAAELVRGFHDPALAYLYGIAVSPRFRGKGIGTFLLDSILKDLPPAGLHRLQLTVDPGNQNALHIYRDKFGMRILQSIPNYFGRGEDRLLLEWSWHEKNDG